MSRTRTNGGDPTVRTKLSDSFVRALSDDFEAHGLEVIKELREKHPERYSELVGRLIVAEQNRPDPTADDSPKDSQDVGRRLLADFGISDANDQDIQAALGIYDDFVEQMTRLANQVIH